MGNVVNEIEIIDNGKPFGVTRIAIDNGYKDKKETLFINVKLFGNALSDAQYYDIQKGDRISIEGRLVENSYVKDDVKIVKYEIIASWVRKIARPVAQVKEEKVDGGWYDE